MIQILLFLFSLILIVLGWYFKKHLTDLIIVFKESNKQNINNLATTLLILGIIGLILGLFFATKVVALFFISIVLISSGFFSIRLSKKMK